MTSSEVVYNTGMPDQVNLPTAMGTPADGQATGTPLELLAEISGRVCYDSFGRGRSSSNFHSHILEVGHLSVYEHCTFTVEFDDWRSIWCKDLINRPGVHYNEERGKPRLTVNARAVLEWNKYPSTRGSMTIGAELSKHGASLMPQVIKPTKAATGISRVVSPINSDELWVSVWLYGSRGFSHEMVRHGDNTAISQRSTRYVDESESALCWHPALLSAATDEIAQNLLYLEAQTKEAYRRIVEHIESCGHSRKVARGAARGVLPNSLSTQMIFSASLSQWNHIFTMRCSPFADDEIREIMQSARRSIHGGYEQSA